MPPRENWFGRELAFPFGAQARQEFLRAGSFLLLLSLAASLSLQAQTAAAGRSPGDGVQEGKGMFQQRCSVCHLPLVIDDDRTYGPRLSAETVTGKEA
ncbi:MAG: hypothetical protein ACRD88_20125, partial [Terriglobia bacterium]